MVQNEIDARRDAIIQAAHRYHATIRRFEIRVDNNILAQQSAYDEMAELRADHESNMIEFEVQQWALDGEKLVPNVVDVLAGVRAARGGDNEELLEVFRRARSRLFNIVNKRTDLEPSQWMPAAEITGVCNLLVDKAVSTVSDADELRFLVRWRNCRSFAVVSGLEFAPVSLLEDAQLEAFLNNVHNKLSETPRRLYTSAPADVPEPDGAKNLALPLDNIVRSVDLAGNFVVASMDDAIDSTPSDIVLDMTVMHELALLHSDAFENYAEELLEHLLRFEAERQE